MIREGAARAHAFNGKQASVTSARGGAPAACGALVLSADALVGMSVPVGPSRLSPSPTSRRADPRRRRPASVGARDARPTCALLETGARDRLVLPREGSGRRRCGRDGWFAAEAAVALPLADHPIRAGQHAHDALALVAGRARSQGSRRCSDGRPGEGRRPVDAVTLLEAAAMRVGRQARRSKRPGAPNVASDPRGITAGSNFVSYGKVA